jgi:hypothetical protein
MTPCCHSGTRAYFFLLQEKWKFGEKLKRTLGSVFAKVLFLNWRHYVLMNSRWDKLTDAVKVQEVEDFVRELKVHGLVRDGAEEQTFAITEKAVCLIEEAMRQMRQRYPKASEEDVKFRALIFIVLDEMGNAVRKCVPVYVGILNSLTEQEPLSK